jgi:2-dehydropantoate 2-reductase
MTYNNVTLVGLGAMGVWFASKLEPYLGKENFRILAGGDRKKRHEEKGVTINGKNYKFSVIDPETKGNPSDLIIIAVKDMHLDQAIEDMANQVGENTQIICVMNGVESEEKVAAAYGWHRTMYSYMRVSIVMNNGVANFDPEFGMVSFGEATNHKISKRVKALADLFDAADINYQIDEDMIKSIWFKYTCNISENMTCALLGIPFGAFRISDYANNIRRAAIKEVVAIAHKKGIDISEADIEHHESVILNIPFHNKPSTLQDIEALRKTEVDMFAGNVVKMGQEYNIPTPISFLYMNGIKVLEEKNDGLFNGPLT